MNTEQKITAKTWAHYASGVLFDLYVSLRHKRAYEKQLSHAIAAKVAAQEFLKAVEPLIEQLKKE